jgi:hypothetical protein
LYDRIFTLAKRSAVVELDGDDDQVEGRDSPVRGSQLPARRRTGDPFGTLSCGGFCYSSTATYTVVRPLEVRVRPIRLRRVPAEK